MLSTFQFITITLSVGGVLVSAIIWLFDRLQSMSKQQDSRCDKYENKNQQQHSEFKSRLQKVESEQGKYVLHTECSEHRQRLRDAIDNKAQK